MKQVNQGDPISPYYCLVVLTDNISSSYRRQSLYQMCKGY